MLPATDPQENRWRIDLALERDADLAPLRAWLASVPFAERDTTYEKNALNLHLFEHDADALSRTVAASTHSEFTVNGAVYSKFWYAGIAARMRGDKSGAQSAFAAARLEAQKTADTNPMDGLNLSILAMIDAALGHSEDAIEEARQACNFPREQSANRAPRTNSNLAVVYAWTNHPDLAIATLRKLMNKASGNSYPIQPSYGDLKLNPVWDPTRGEEGFAPLLKQLTSAQAGKVLVP